MLQDVRRDSRPGQHEAALDHGQHPLGWILALPIGADDRADRVQVRHGKRELEVEERHLAVWGLRDPPGLLLVEHQHDGHGDVVRRGAPYLDHALGLGRAAVQVRELQQIPQRLLASLLRDEREARSSEYLQESRLVVRAVAIALLGDQLVATGVMLLVHHPGPSMGKPASLSALIAAPTASSESTGYWSRK